MIFFSKSKPNFKRLWKEERDRNRLLEERLESLVFTNNEQRLLKDLLIEVEIVSGDIHKPGELYSDIDWKVIDFVSELIRKIEARGVKEE